MVPKERVYRVSWVDIQGLVYIWAKSDSYLGNRLLSFSFDQNKTGVTCKLQKRTIGSQNVHFSMIPPMHIHIYILLYQGPHINLYFLPQDVAESNSLWKSTQVKDPLGKYI